MRARVAEAAIAAGATIVNDVSGGRADRAMVKVLADAGIPWILMHWRPLSPPPTTTATCSPIPSTTSAAIVTWWPGER